MYTVLTSDLHLHPHRIGSRGAGLDRLDDGLRVLDDSLALAQQWQASWVMLGDFKLPRTFWPQNALTGAYAVLTRYPTVPKLLLAGNHDGHGTWGSGLRPFRNLPQTRIIDTPQLLRLPGFGLVACWPGNRSFDEFPAFRRQALARRVKVLFTHVMLSTALVGTTVLPGKGIPLWAIGRRRPFDLIVSGDIHTGQRLVQYGSARPFWSPFRILARVEQAEHGYLVRRAGPWGGDVIYPGSPYQQSWGEQADWPKGVLRVECASGRLWLHPSRAPRFRLIDWRLIEWPRVTLVAAAAWQDDIVRVMPGPWAADPRAGAILERIRERSGARCFEVMLPPPVSRSGRLAVDPTLSTRQLLEAYITTRADSDVPLGQLLQAGLELVEPPGDA